MFSVHSVSPPPPRSTRLSDISEVHRKWRYLEENYSAARSSFALEMFPLEDAPWSSGMPNLPVFSVILILSLLVLLGLYRLFFHPLASIPGPLFAKLTCFWHVYHSYRGDELSLIQDLHRKHGKVVRIGPNTVNIADGAALGPIYVEKGGFMKPTNYHNFYVDGFPTIFSTSDPAYRATRAKAVASLFSVAAVRRESNLIFTCVERFVQRLQQSKARSEGRPVDLQEPARMLGFEMVNSFLFRHEYPHMVDGASDKSIIPWLNAFVDASRLFYFSERWFGFCLSKLDRWRPQKDLEEKSAASVHEFALNLPAVASDGNEKGDSYQGRLYQHGIPRDQIAAECKDVWFAAVHSFGAVLGTTLWYLAADTTM